MKTTLKIENQLLENREKFKGQFFEQFRLRHAPSPLKLNDQVSKNYLFPTFYSEVTCAVAVFHCNYEKAKAIMPHSQVMPVKMTFGRSLVAFSCYHYKNVLGLPSYNEIAMSIPVIAGKGVRIPVLPALVNFSKRFGYFVFSMPVTSLENQIRGHKIWGLPKVTQEIDLFENNGDFGMGYLH